MLRRRDSARRLAVRDLRPIAALILLVLSPVWGAVAQRGAGQIVILAKDDTKIYAQADSTGASVGDLAARTQVLVDSGAAIRDAFLLIAYPKRGWVAMGT